MFIAWGLAVILPDDPLHGAATAEQRRELLQIRTDLRKAGNFYTQGQFKQSGAVVRDVQQRVEQLRASGDPEVLQMLSSITASLQRAHALLELEGVALPALQGSAAPATTGTVSFTRQVAPVLVAKCAQCHINNSRGMLRMSSYAELMRGTPDGAVVLAGDSKGSRIVEVIESGDMPRGGGNVTAEELQLIKTWIAAGARYDGANPQERLTQLVPAESRPDVPQVVQATGGETVSFARDIAPVLAQQCAGCHGDGQTSNGLNLTMFETMLRGGDNGPPIQPGLPDMSLLIGKLQGTASGERMPRGQPPLPDDAIGRFITWIREGATFDGASPRQHVADVAAMDKARRATHDELSAERAARAVRNWSLGMPGGAYMTVKTDSFLLIGDVSSEVLQEYGEQAEAIAQEVMEMLRVPTAPPLLKGRLTLFFFSGRYEYSEFGKMVEQRQIPKTWQGHWFYDVVDAYATVLPPERATAEDGSYTLDGLLAQLIASAYVASLNESVPRWFAEGAGRVVAAQLITDDTRVRQWNQQLPRVLALLEKPADFLEGKLPPDETDIASYSFVEYLMSDVRRFARLQEGLREGHGFDQVFAVVYGGKPQQISEAWAPWAVRQASRRAR